MVKLGRQAIVVGAGIGGLLAAAVLAEYFETVLVFEKDRLCDDPQPRKGVPQGPQVHALVKRGENILADIFPQFRARLVDAGAMNPRFGLDVPIFEGGGWQPKRDNGLALFTQSRALLEGVVRGCLLDLANVEIRDGARLRNFRLSAQNEITGIEIAGENGGADAFIEADLTIDAAGRGSLLPKWLIDNGFGEVPTSKLGIDICYVTLLLNQPPEFAGKPDGWVVRSTAPRQTRGATMLAIEGERWLLTLVSRFGGAPALNLADCLEFAGSLEVPEVHDWARQASLDTPPRRFNIPQSLLSHFDRLEKFPDRLLPLGDVIGTFNPLQAQGMTIAACHGEHLRAALERCREDGGGLAGLTQAYLQGAVAISANAWHAAATNDFAYPQTRGERPADLAGRLRFRRALREIIEHDPDLHRDAMLVQQMLAPSSILRRPDVLARAAEL